MSDFFELRERLRREVPKKPEQRELARALVVDNEATHRTYVTVPLEQAALTRDDFLMHIDGRLVEAEKANANGAFWSTPDLQFGLDSVAAGPVNWLHQERRILGCIMDANMVTQETADGIGPHIRARSVLWSYLWPKECDLIEQAASAGRAFYSMECLAERIRCVGETGCGCDVPYLESFTEKACEHIRERTGTRHFVNPIFQGAGIIVPPTSPGWANAHIEVIRQAAASMESYPEQARFLAGDEVLAAQLMAFIREGTIANVE